MSSACSVLQSCSYTTPRPWSLVKGKACTIANTSPAASKPSAAGAGQAQVERAILGKRAGGGVDLDALFDAGGDDDA